VRGVGCFFLILRGGEGWGMRDGGWDGIERDGDGDGDGDGRFGRVGNLSLRNLSA